MSLVITGDLSWSGDLVLFLEALDGGPAADVAGYDFASSGDIEYSATVPEPVDPEDRLLGLYRCVTKTAGGVIAGAGYVTIGTATAAVRIRSEQAVELDSTARVKLAAEQPDYTPATSAALAAMRGADNDTLKTLSDQIDGIEGGGGGGTATLEKQEEILTAIQGSQVIQVPSPNVQGNLVLTQGDSYDGIANPKASWTVTTDYTDGWSVTLTIRDSSDAVIYTTSGTVVSATVIAVQIAAPTGLTMTGCPGQWQGKFDVELTKAGSKKTIALGVCYVNEDQTR